MCSIRFYNIPTPIPIHKLCVWWERTLYIILYYITEPSAAVLETITISLYYYIVVITTSVYNNIIKRVNISAVRSHDDFLVALIPSGLSPPPGRFHRRGDAGCPCRPRNTLIGTFAHTFLVRLQIRGTVVLISATNKWDFSRPIIQTVPKLLFPTSLVTSPNCVLIIIIIITFINK